MLATAGIIGNIIYIFSRFLIFGLLIVDYLFIFIIMLSIFTYIFWGIGIVDVQSYRSLPSRREEPSRQEIISFLSVY